MPPRFRIRVGFRFVVEDVGDETFFFFLGRVSDGTEGAGENSTRVVVRRRVFIEGADPR